MNILCSAKVKGVGYFTIDISVGCLTRQGLVGIRYTLAPIRDK